MRKKGWRYAGVVWVMRFGLVMMAAGCNRLPQHAVPSDHEATPRVGEERLAFSWYNNNDAFNPTPWGQNVVSKWVESNKNVHVDWVLPGGSAKQKLNSMIVTGNLPDVIDMGGRGPDVDRLVQAGSLVPLDDYVKKYPNLRKYAGESTLDMLRSSDGKLYQFPIWYSPPGKAKGNGGYAVEKRIYRALGSPKLETTSDLEAYLLLVKMKDPDVIPLEVGPKFEGADNLYTAFGEYRSKRFLGSSGGVKGLGAYPVGNQLKLIYTDPAFSGYMTYVSRLYRENLITPDGFTQTRDQFVEKLNAGKVAVVSSSDLANEAALPDSRLKANDPNDGYMMIWPIHQDGVDKSKVTVNSYDQLGSGVNVITRKAKDPERIFAFLDWMTGEEGQRIFWYGPPGLLYDQVDDKGIPWPNEKFKESSRQDLNRLEVPYLDLVGNTMYIDTTKVARDNMLPPEKRDFTIQAQNGITWKSGINVTEFVNLDPLPDAEEGLISQRLTDLYTQTYTKVIFAQSDREVQQLLDQAQDDAVKAGADRLLRFMTDKWQNNRQLLNESN